MTTIAITAHGPVIGSHPELVAAAVEAVTVVPAQRSTQQDQRLDNLVAAVRIPWARVAVTW